MDKTTGYENKIANKLNLVAIIVYVVCFIVDIIMIVQVFALFSYVDGGIGIALMVAVACITMLFIIVGLILQGMGEIVEMMTRIRRKRRERMKSNEK